MKKKLLANDKMKGNADIQIALLIFADIQASPEKTKKPSRILIGKLFFSQCSGRDERRKSNFEDEFRKPNDGKKE